MLMTAEMHHHIYACIGLSPCTNCKDRHGSSRNPIMRKRALRDLKYILKFLEYSKVYLRHLSFLQCRVST